MDLQKKLKVALNDNRLLILGTQVLFGFQFNGIFQELFVELPYPSRVLEAWGLTLLMISVAFLVAPSMHHRLVDDGRDNARVLKLATDFAGFALLPLTFALAFDMFVAVAWTLGLFTGAAIGATFFLVAILSWYVLGFFLRSKKPTMAKDKTVRTPLDVQVDQLLTEARLIIPGAQALLGFQFAVTLMRAFAELPEAVKMLHVAALCCIGLAVILLMAPASIHRIAFGGEDDPAFVRVASFFVVAAPLPHGGWTRNDRLVAVATHAQTYQKAKSFSDLRPHLVDEIIEFFVSYNKLRGRKFKPGKTVGSGKAEELIKAGMKKFRRKHTGK